jgi:uridine kinase
MLFAQNIRSYGLTNSYISKTFVSPLFYAGLIVKLGLISSIHFFDLVFNQNINLSLPLQVLLIILIDLSILVGLTVFLNSPKPLKSYYLSPIPILIYVFFGVNLALSSLLLLLMLFFIKKKNIILFFGALLLNCYLNPFIVFLLPFVFHYFFSNKLYTRNLFFYILSSLILILLVFYINNYFYQLIQFFKNTTSKNFLNSDYPFNIFIFSYILIFYFFYCLKKINLKILSNLLVVVSLSLLMLSKELNIFYVIMLPLLFIYEFDGNISDSLLFYFFSVLFLLNNSIYLLEYNGIIYSLFISAGVLFVWKVWRDGIKRNDYFIYNSKPLTIGISGDSGVGKDTLAYNLQCIFGKNDVTHISGDNYHRWDRKKEIWKSLTHLNPLSNDLNTLYLNIYNLLKRKSIMLSIYDHKTGIKKSISKIKSTNIIISSGLHTFINTSLKNLFDLCVYLDMDKNLKNYLRLQRDTSERGHDSRKYTRNSLARFKDFTKYVQPQDKVSDLSLKVEIKNFKKNAKSINNEFINNNFELHVENINDINFFDVYKSLLSFANLRIDLYDTSEYKSSRLRVSGSIFGEDLKIIFKRLCINISGLLDDDYEWPNGLSGLILFFTLYALEIKIRNKLLNND